MWGASCVAAVYDDRCPDVLEEIRIRTRGRGEERALLEEKDKSDEDGKRNLQKIGFGEKSMRFSNIADENCGVMVQILQRSLIVCAGAL